MAEPHRADRVDRALGAWRDAGVPLDDPDAQAAREERLVAPLAAALSNVGRQRARRRGLRALALFAAVAAVLLAGIGVQLATRAPETAPPPAAIELATDSRDVLTLRAGAPRFLDPGARTALSPGDELSVPELGAARLTLSSGAEVGIEAATRLRIASSLPDETLELVRGSVRVSVPKLVAPHTLSIQTPHARVVVRGTRFSVRVSERAGVLESSVEVEQGEVAVLHAAGHVALRPGQSWSSAPRPAPLAAARASPAERSAGDGAAPAASLAPSARSHAAPRRSADQLAAENRLYRDALRARNRGDDVTAIALFSKLMADHADSPLVNEARRERARALERTNSKRAP